MKKNYPKKETRRKKKNKKQTLNQEHLSQAQLSLKQDVRTKTLSIRVAAWLDIRVGTQAKE